MKPLSSTVSPCSSSRRTVPWPPLRRLEQFGPVGKRRLEFGPTAVVAVGDSCGASARQVRRRLRRRRCGCGDRCRPSRERLRPTSPARRPTGSRRQQPSASQATSDESFETSCANLSQSSLHGDYLSVACRRCDVERPAAKSTRPCRLCTVVPRDEARRCRRWRRRTAGRFAASAAGAPAAALAMCCGCDEIGNRRRQTPQSAVGDQRADLLRSAGDAELRTRPTEFARRTSGGSSSGCGGGTSVVQSTIGATRRRCVPRAAIGLAGRRSRPSAIARRQASAARRATFRLRNLIQPAADRVGDHLLRGGCGRRRSEMISGLMNTTSSLSRTSVFARAEQLARRASCPSGTARP